MDFCYSSRVDLLLAGMLEGGGQSTDLFECGARFA